MWRLAFAIFRIRRIVAKLRILDEMPDNVDAEAVDSLAKPEAHYVMDGLAHRWIAPIQIGLLGEEGMMIILPRRGIILPGAASEFRQPIVRRTAIGARLMPDVPVAFRIVARTSALHEPGMPFGRMVRHEVENDFKTAGMHGFGQHVEILHRAKQGIDANVIRDVVTEVSHRRGKDRRQPDRVNAKRLQIRQSINNTREVADPVTIGVLKGSRVELIENAIAPPGFDARGHVQLVFRFSEAISAGVGSEPRM